MSDDISLKNSYLPLFVKQGPDLGLCLSLLCWPTIVHSLQETTKFIPNEGFMSSWWMHNNYDSHDQEFPSE